MEVAVLGAGVIGLTLAYQLSEASKTEIPAAKITVLTKSLPIDPEVDYTSQYAGANWRSVCSNADFKMIGYEEATLKYFREFSKRHPDLVNECMSYDVFDPREADVNDQRIVRKTAVADGEMPWFERICKKFSVTAAQDLPEGAAFGIGFDTVTLNAPEYVKWLYKECLKRGVTFQKKTVESFDEIDSSFKIIFNCTGLGARKLCGDSKVYPTRGQTVLVKNTTNMVNTYSRVGQNHLSYLIPRPGDGGLIIGGCQQPNNWDYTVDEGLADKMLEWARTLYPGIFPADHKFEIIKHNVGLRPSRIGGARVETEEIGDRLIIHGYGIGGWGFQASWGLALKMIILLSAALKQPESAEEVLRFTYVSALAKVKKAQNLWNTKNAVEVTKAYTETSIWRNRDIFIQGHGEIRAFLEAKWLKEHNYRLRKELFTFAHNRIAVEFFYEYSIQPSEDSEWRRCYGIEHWTFDNDGRMRSRQMSGNEVAIKKEERWFVNDNVDSVKLPAGHLSD